jgi:hypothetical protein
MKPVHRHAVPCASLLLCFSCATHATEGNGNSYPLGVETNMSGLMLPEGLTSLLYYNHYKATHVKGNDGHDSANIARYRVKSDTVSLRLSYVWPGVKWLGANVETRAALAVPTLDVTLDVARPAPLAPLDKGGTDTGLADLSFAPVLLGWHGKALHQTAGVETFLPTGTYDKNQPVNTGRNYYQVAPFYAVTWLPGEHWEASAKLRYGINSKNDATDYRSGDELTLEFSGGYRFSQALSFGINGYLYRQTTDDRLQGEAVNGNGNRGSVNALGPYVMYRFTKDFALVAKMQDEFDARNKAQGTRFWLQARLPF